MALLACGSDPAPDANTGDPGTAELGIGTTAWEPIADGDDIELHAGPQGGHHFIVHSRIADLLPGDPAIAGALGNPRTKFSALLDGDQVDQNLPAYQLGYEDLGDGFFYLASGRLLIMREEHVSAVIGSEVVIRLEVEDASGRRGVDERTLTVVEAPPFDAPDAGPGPDAGELVDAGVPDGK